MGITTISLSDSDKKLIKEYNLSPTALIKEKLMEFYRFDAQGRKEIAELQERIHLLQKINERNNKFINSKGLTDAHITFMLEQDVLEKEKRGKSSVGSSF